MHWRVFLQRGFVSGDSRVVFAVNFTCSCFSLYRKGVELTVNMAGKVTSEANPIVITSGSSAKTVGSPSSDGGRDVRDDRTWKAYVSQMDSPITSSLLVNGEDLNMASSLGFLYDYYEVTEESSQAPPSPPNQG